MQKVQPFSLHTMMWIASNPYLHPSNCELRKVEAKSSIRETIAELAIDIFDRKEKKSQWHEVGKPFRAVARFVAGIGLACIAAPTGTVYHFLRAGDYAIRSVACLTRGSSTNHNWQKVQEHARAFFTDLMITLSACMAAFCWTMAASDPVSILTPGAFLMTTVPLLCAISPTALISWLVYKEDRASIFKSLELYNAFGLVNEKAGLLPSDSKDDEDWGLNGPLGQQWVAQGTEIAQLLGEIHKAYPFPRSMRQAVLPRESQTIMEYIDKKPIPPFCPNYSDILKYLREKKEEVSDSKFDEWIQRIETLSKQMNIINKFINNCLKEREHNIFNDNTIYINALLKTRPFPLTNESYRYFFENPSFVSKEITNWQETLEKLKKDVFTLEPHFIPEGKEDTYQQLKDAITAGKSRKEMLDYDPNDPLPLKKKYRQLMFVLHPDKVPDPKTNAAVNEATELFKFVQQQKAVIEAEASQPS